MKIKVGDQYGNTFPNVRPDEEVSFNRPTTTRFSKYAREPSMMVIFSP